MGIYLNSSHQPLLNLAITILADHPRIIHKPLGYKPCTTTVPPHPDPFNHILVEKNIHLLPGQKHYLVLAQALQHYIRFPTTQNIYIPFSVTRQMVAGNFPMKGSLISVFEYCLNPTDLLTVGTQIMRVFFYYVNNTCTLLFRTLALGDTSNSVTYSTFKFNFINTTNRQIST